MFSLSQGISTKYCVMVSGTLMQVFFEKDCLKFKMGKMEVSVIGFYICVQNILPWHQNTTVTKDTSINLKPSRIV